MADGEELKKDFMFKRSQLKGRFYKTINYRSRWFVLTNKVLRYHDGTLTSGVGSEKGRMSLDCIRAVELADELALDNNPNAFQVMHQDPSTSENVTLYIFALHSMQRDDWIDAIRKACDKNGTEFAKKFHFGVWDIRNRRYSCCDRINKRDPGCQTVTFYTKAHTINTSNIAAAAAAAVANGDSSDSSATSKNKRNLPKLGTGATPKQSSPSVAPKPKINVIKKVIAIYDYEKAEDTDLSLIKGDIYDVLDDSKKYWWSARNKKGEEGYIPSNYVEPLTDNGLEQYDWFYPSTNRAESESILKNETKEGCFLVRDASNPGMYTLSIYTKEVPEGVVRHYHIKQQDKKEYYLSDKHSFKTIPDLISYHKFNCAGLVVRLRSPPNNRDSNQPVTAGLGHDLFEISEEHLDMGEELGRGNFGIVRRATYTKNSTIVAVKQLNKSNMSEEDFIEEARTMALFQHPNLVQLMGVCIDKRPISIVCEYMKFGALLQFLRRRKNTLMRKPDKLLYMCTQVCNAMAYLESKQFIHRDLAARNCLVSEREIIKVGDFGLTRFVVDDEYTCSTGTKFPIKWASPEVLQYTTFSSKSDVWAFGVLMWEIWTGGETPYKELQNTEVIEHVVHKKYRLEQPAICSPDVYNVMLDTWKMKPEHRPAFSTLYPRFVKFDPASYVLK